MRKLLVLLGQELRRSIRNFYYEMTTLLLFGLLTYLGLKLGYTYFIPKIQRVNTTFWMLPNLVAFVFMIFTYLHAAEGIFAKKSTGYLGYLRTTDLSPGALTSVFTIDAIIKGLIKSILLLLLYWLLFGSVGSAMHWVLFFAEMLLIGIFWAGLGIISGLIVRQSIVSSHLLIGVILPVIFMSGMFYPVAEYPPSLMTVLSFLPPALGFVSGRAIVGIIPWEQYFIPVLIGWAVIAFIGALLLLKAERN